MQTAGQPKFLKCHHGSIRGVAFSPKHRFLFCSCGYDGKVNFYCALRGQLLKSHQTNTFTVAKNVNSVKWSSDGDKILATTTAKRLAVLDVEKGTQVLAYENCAFNGRERTSIATDPSDPYLVACISVNGKGLSIFDLRMPLPRDFIYDLHAANIKDVQFMNESWPCTRGHTSLLTLDANGSSQLNGLDGQHYYTFDTTLNRGNCICITPENYNQSATFGYTSSIMYGGDYSMVSYIPETGVEEIIRHNDPCLVMKLKYDSNGSFLYSLTDNGVLRRYRRHAKYHEFLEEMYPSKTDIHDFDISPYDEYIVTSSRDKSVGIMLLGAPNHGYTEYHEFT